MRAVLYSRVSTSDQNTLPMQIQKCQEYAKARGWNIVSTVQDIASGAKQRPQREELLKMARKRQIDVIVVWKLDRWGRSTSDVVNSLEELRELNEARSKGVRLGRPSLEKSKSVQVNELWKNKTRKSLDHIEQSLALKMNENTANKVVFQVQDSEDVEWFCSLLGTKTTQLRVTI